MESTLLIVAVVVACSGGVHAVRHRGRRLAVPAATLVLLGLVGLCLVTAAATPRAQARVLGVIGLLAGTALLVAADLHGVGFAVGALTGLVAALRERRRRGKPLEPGRGSLAQYPSAG